MAVGWCRGSRGGARGRGPRPGWSAVRCATPRSDGRSDDLDLAVDGDPARGGPAGRSRARRIRLRALGGVPDLAGPATATAPGRSTSRRCAAAASRPTSALRDFTVGAVAVGLDARRGPRPVRRPRRPRSRGALRAVGPGVLRRRSAAADAGRAAGRPVRLDVDPETVELGLRVTARGPPSRPASASSPSSAS